LRARPLALALPRTAAAARPIFPGQSPHQLAAVTHVIHTRRNPGPSSRRSSLEPGKVMVKSASRHT
jgi:hypothetical protein